MQLFLFLFLSEEKSKWQYQKDKKIPPGNQSNDGYYSSSNHYINLNAFFYLKL